MFVSLTVNKTQIVKLVVYQGTAPLTIGVGEKERGEMWSGRSYPQKTAFVCGAVPEEAPSTHCSWWSSHVLPLATDAA